MPVIDERGTQEQRDALLRILTGQDTEPGATNMQDSHAHFAELHMNQSGVVRQ